MGDARFEDLEPGNMHLRLDLFFETIGDFLAGALQRFFCVVVEAVVRILAHDGAQRGVALGCEIIFVIVHVEHSLGGVGHAPDHDDPDHHRIAELVVDLLLTALEGHRFEADLRGFAVAHRAAEWVVPVKSFALDGAGIFPEEGQHHRFIRTDHGKAAEHEAIHDEEHHAERDPRAAADHKERRRSSGQKRERHEEHEESVDRRHLALFHADILLHLVCHCCSFLSFTDVVSV